MHEVSGADGLAQAPVERRTDAGPMQWSLLEPAGAPVVDARAATASRAGPVSGRTGHPRSRAAGAGYGRPSSREMRESWSSRCSSVGCEESSLLKD